MKLFGWSVDITVDDYPKCVICVAPHTSNVDFALGKLAYWSVGRKAGFLMKSSWFFFPLGLIFRAMGGIPVYRDKSHGSVVEQVVRRFNAAQHLSIAITPEGTRARTDKWHTGFLQIARQAHVPIVLGVIDAVTHRIMINTTFYPTGDDQADLRSIKLFYRPFKGIHPENFSTDESSDSPD